MARFETWLRCSVLFLIIGLHATQAKETKSLRCYECNVWKAGYGNLCEDPRIVDGCSTCMKIETKVYMGYYKDTPRSSTMITRICGNDYTAHFGSECLHYKMVDGYSKRCFCESDLCNSAQRLPGSAVGVVTIATTAYALYRALC